MPFRWHVRHGVPEAVQAHTERPVGTKMFQVFFFVSFLCASAVCEKTFPVANKKREGRGPNNNLHGQQEQLPAQHARKNPTPLLSQHQIRHV